MAPLMNCSALILAAGKGTRMKSPLPKVMQPLLEEPMLYYVIQALRKAGISLAASLVIGPYKAIKNKQEGFSHSPSPPLLSTHDHFYKWSVESPTKSPVCLHTPLTFINWPRSLKNPTSASPVKGGAGSFPPIEIPPYLTREQEVLSSMS